MLPKNSHAPSSLAQDDVLFRALRRVPRQQRQGNDGEHNSNIREQEKKLLPLFRPLLFWSAVRG